MPEDVSESESCLSGVNKEEEEEKCNGIVPVPPREKAATTPQTVCQISFASVVNVHYVCKQILFRSPPRQPKALPSLLQH